MEISKREARHHLRRVLALLNERSRADKAITRGRFASQREGYMDAQARLQHTRAQLTVVHGMLALSRRRVHPINPFVAQAIQGGTYLVVGVMEHEKNAYLLRYCRSILELRGETHLAHLWTGLRDELGLPTLATVWRALISSISNPEAREAAFRTGGEVAAGMIPRDPGYAIPDGRNRMVYDYDPLLETTRMRALAK